MTKENLSKCSKCRRYCRLVTTFLFSHIGLCGLVVGYSLLGAFTFEALEAGYERTKRQTMVKERENVVMGLWSLTATSSVLSEKNWSALATETLQDFEVTLVKAVRKDGYDGKDESPLQWSFSGALLYSIIVITTIGYGNVAPKTPWGKVVTIFYAIIGIPLLLLCLSNIGDAMAHSFKFLYWKVCCYFCIRPKRHRKRKMNSSRVLTVPYRTQIVQQPPLPPPQFPSPESPELPSNSTYHTAQTSGSPTISSCKSTPRHEVHQMLPFSPVAYPHKTECMASPYTNTASHDISYYPPRKVVMAPVITNRYAMQEDVKLDARPLQIRKKEGTAIGPGIFSIMNSRNNENFHYGNRQMYATHDGYPWKDDYPDADQNSIGCLSSDQGDDAEEVSVPMWLCFAVVIGYICGGAVLFTFWEKWNFLDSSYFCFVTLTTIGFGDLVPGTAVISDDAQLTLGLCSLYLLFGMALLAMSFNLVQEEVTRSVRSVGKRIGIISDDEDD